MNGAPSSGRKAFDAVSPWLLVCPILFGCGRGAFSEDPAQDSPTAVTSFAVRASRRLYDGAPPVIPHAPLKISCIECHSAEGKATPPLGTAPANPHLNTPGVGSSANCRQCHVFQTPAAPLAENEFSGLPQLPAKGERLYPAAPPVMPHGTFMREDCQACHDGPAARAEIRCTHPLRTHCRQCHATSRENPPSPELSDLLLGE